MMLRVGKVVQSHFTADRRRASNRMPLREWKISGKCLMPLKQTQRVGVDRDRDRDRDRAGYTTNTHWTVTGQHSKALH